MFLCSLKLNLFCDIFLNFSEEVTGAWQSVNGSEEDIFKVANLETLLDELDKLLDSDTSDKESVYYKMTAKKDEVSNCF